MENNRVFPAWVWITYSVLFLLSIPWYLTEQLGMTLVLGLPIWLHTSIFFVFLMAVFTWWIIHKYWTD